MVNRHTHPAGAEADDAGGDASSEAGAEDASLVILEQGDAEASDEVVGLEDDEDGRSGEGADPDEDGRSGDDPGAAPDAGPPDGVLCAAAAAVILMQLSHTGAKAFDQCVARAAVGITSGFVIFQLIGLSGLTLMALALMRQLSARGGRPACAGNLLGASVAMSGAALLLALVAEFSGLVTSVAAVAVLCAVIAAGMAIAATVVANTRAPAG
jgi:hypothetical protein